MATEPLILDASFEDPMTDETVTLRYVPNLDATYADYEEMDDSYRESRDALRREMTALKTMVVSVEGYERLEELPKRWVLPFAGHCHLRELLGSNYGEIMERPSRAEPSDGTSTPAAEPPATS